MPQPPAPRSKHHDFPGRRWLIVILRGLHLVAVIALGALMLGAPSHPAWPFAAVANAVLISGLAMLVLDVFADRRHLRTVAGLTVLAKLGLVAALAFYPERWLFWAIVWLSAIVSHAPGRFRNTELF
jgi:hypothetical protein